MKRPAKEQMRNVFVSLAIVAGMITAETKILKSCEESDRREKYQELVQMLPLGVQAEIGDPTIENVDNYFVIFDRYHCLAQAAGRAGRLTPATIGELQVYPLNLSFGYDIELLVVDQNNPPHLTQFKDNHWWFPLPKKQWFSENMIRAPHYGTLNAVSVNGFVMGYNAMSSEQQSRFYNQYRTIVTQMIPVLEERVHSTTMCKK